MMTSQLAPVEVAPLLRATLEILAAEIVALPDEALSWHPAPDEWCIKEVLGHLIEAERRGFAGRIREILASHEPSLEGWDPAAVARARRDCGKDVRTLLDELQRLRDASAALVESLSGADLGRAGVHPSVGRLRVADLLHEWVHHDRNHLKQALANVQAFVWPHLANAQKFSIPAA